MTIPTTTANAIKLRLIQQFYGLEEYMDLTDTIPNMLSTLDNQSSEFCFLSALNNLDLWYIRVSNPDNEEIWNPFRETLVNYAQRHELLTAHLYAEKQWSNNQILTNLGLRKTQL